MSDIAEKMPSRNNETSCLIPLLRIVVFILLLWLVGLPYFILKDADRLVANEKFEEASEIYAKHKDNLIWGRSANEKYSNALTLAADNAVLEKDYYHAIEICRVIGDVDKTREVQTEAAEYFYANEEYEKAANLYEELGESDHAKMAWRSLGSMLLNNKEYENAIDAYDKANDTDKVKSIHYVWAQDLIKDKQFDNAVEHLSKAGRRDKIRETILLKADYMIKEEDVGEILDDLKPYTGKDVAELLFRAQQVGIEDVNSDDAVDAAREYGESITDADTQLHYSWLLYSNNYDLNRVYPDGVVVNQNLGAYQIYNDYEGGKTDEPDYSRVVVFSRQESVPTLRVKKTYSQERVETALDDEMLEKKNGKYECMVKLHPELIIDFPEAKQAWEMDNCTAFVVLDDGYLPLGGITIRTMIVDKSGKSFGQINNTSYGICMSYAAYGAITVYDKKDPDLFRNYDSYYNVPLVADSVIGNSYSDAGIDLTGLQIEEIQNALRDKTSAESQNILKQYDAKVIEFVEANGWGDYILIPDKDEEGNPKNYKGTADNVSSWNISKYMVGQRNDNWIKDTLNDGALKNLASYFIRRN